MSGIIGPAVNVWTERAARGGGVADRMFYLNDPFGYNLFRFDPLTMSGVFLKSLGTAFSYSIGYDQPRGKIIVYRRSNPTLGWNEVTLAGAGPTGLGVEEATGVLLQQNAGVLLLDGKIFYINNNFDMRSDDWPGGGAQATHDNVNGTTERYFDLDYDPVNDWIYGACRRGGLRRIRPDGSGLETLKLGSVSESYFRVRVDPWNGFVFVSFEDKRKVRFSMSDFSSYTVIGTPPDGTAAYLLEVNPATETVYWIGNPSGTNALYEYDYSGNQLRTSTDNINDYRASTYGPASEAPELD